MCGISGYYSQKLNFGQEELALMTSAMPHRGPDATGHFREGPIGLGHNRLSIIDLSDSANQPFHSYSNRYVISYNGETYNYRELAKKLDINARTSSDTEILIEGYEKLGKKLPEQLNGMFAFAIYDRQEKKLFIARDRAGIKPLYYYHEGTDFVFASELKALLKIPAIRQKQEIDKKAISLYLNLGYIPEPYTIYNGIKKFPSSSYAYFDGKTLKITKYWDVQEKIEEQYTTSSLKSRLNELLTDSISKRLISDVPYGCFLSGGTDSSLITAIASRQSKSKLKTFTIGFKDKKYNEAEHAKKIARHLGTDHHEYYVSEQDAIGLSEEILPTYDEPYADSSAIPTMLISKIASQEVKMILSGDGGDELFHGYGSYIWANRLSNPLVKMLRSPAGHLLKLLGNKYERAAGLFQYQDINTIRSHIFSQEQYLFSRKEIQKLLCDEYKMEYAIDENFAELKRKLKPAEAQAFFDINYYLKDDLLVKTDRASMKYSLETRVPILDHRVIEFALNIPPNMKIRNGNAKFLLRELLFDYLPREYFERPKWGFSVPLSRWLKKDLSYLHEDYLSDRSVKEAGIVGRKEVQELKKAYFGGKDYLYNRIWLLAILHMWFSKHNSA